VGAAGVTSHDNGGWAKREAEATRGVDKGTDSYAVAARDAGRGAGSVRAMVTIFEVRATEEG
jgi:hypothetical protein